MEFSGDVARKRGPADRLEIEAAKTQRAAKVGAQSRRFHVPAVVHFDAATGVLETERVHGFVSLMQLAVGRDPRLVAICRRVGAAVAALHADLQLPDSLRVPLPATLSSDPAESCFLHGDLNGSNVGYDPSTDRVVIVDWSAAPALGGVATFGSRYFDIVWFAQFFFRFRPGTALLGWSPELWVDAFLSGYAEVSRTFSADALRAYFERARTFMTNDYQVERSRRGRGLRGASYRVWRQLGWRRWERYLAALSDPRPRGAR